MSRQDTLVREPAAPQGGRAFSFSRSVPGSLPSEDQLEEIVAEGLPTLPSYVFELDARLKAEPFDLKGVSWLIGADPCLAAQVLRICHAMPFAKPALRIEEMVAMAGKDRLQALVLTSPLLRSPETPGRSASQTQRMLQSFWQHSPWTALLSKRLAGWIGYPDAEKAYVAGLLHDIGKVPLMLYGVFAERQEEEGNHHAAIGRLLAEAWNYPPELIEVLALHHCPRQALVDPTLTGIVAAADQYGDRCGLGFDSEEPRLSRPVTAEVVALLHDCLPGLSGENAVRVAGDLENHLLAMLLALGERLSNGSIQRQRS
jgi:putative nucleotidyltransferase with HDIG domain